MRNSPFWWILIGIMILLDIYIFQVVRLLSQSAGQRTRTLIYSGYWGLSVAAILILLLLPYLQFQHQAKLIRSTIFAIVLGLFFAKVVAAIFFLIDDIRRAVQWVAGKLFFRNTDVEDIQEGVRISRSAFLSWTGTIAGAGLFGTLLYGFSNKYNYNIKRVPLRFPNLPAAFKGLKIVQISDIHSGSFTNKEAVLKGVEKILAEQPDLILFTGDIVNDKAEEMDNYIDVFSRLKAPMGVFSTFGNHDYGDYIQWPDRDQAHDLVEKVEEVSHPQKEGEVVSRSWRRHQMSPMQAANLEKLKGVHKALGWRLMMDENVILEKDGQQIALLGVQNISGRSSFYTYGSLKKAYEGTAGIPFKILMSHDPSHWDAEVNKFYKDIDLMLSGHTHGMQFGLEVPGFKWSPVQYVYKQWAGLYEEDKQKLYVNRGYGFIGYPGRVGILPEITVIELS